MAPQEAMTLVAAGMVVTSSSQEAVKLVAAGRVVTEGVSWVCKGVSNTALETLPPKGRAA